MKKFYLVLPLVAFATITLLMSYKTGSPGGKTSSPGDQGANCTSCHAGTPLSINDWISTNIPAGGYFPGDVYTVTVTGTDASAIRFGFELTAEDSTNKKTGIFAITNATDTKLTNGGKSVTHTSAGTTAVGGTRSWNFDWTAPFDYSGKVTFYASVNAANGNGLNTGDQIYKTSSSVFASTTGIIDIGNSYSIYPNPSTGWVTIESNESGLQNTLDVLNSSGQSVRMLNLNQGKNQFDLSGLPKGLYFFRIQSDKDLRMKKLILY